jgi:N-acetylmuramoyl-L-alanine amidase
VEIVIDGKPANMRTPARLYGGTTYVSIRDFCTALGAEHVVRAGNVTVALAPSLKLTAGLGEAYIVANGRYLLGGARAQDGEVLAPVRALAEAFGAKTIWAASSRTAYITRGSGAIVPGELFYSEEDVQWMARIISAEARGEPFLGKVAVGNVVMNRLHSAQFPDTVKGVIFDTNGGVQFTPAASGAIYNTPGEECVAAAKAALDGGEVVGDSLYFASSTKCWAAKRRPYVATLGNHVFYA